MIIEPTVRRRIKWAASIAMILILIVVVTLSFADSYALIENRPHCVPNFIKSKWLMYLGCAMATHEGLAAGLIGGAGAIFAAWIAFDAVQEQLGEDRERRRRQQAEAKVVAVTIMSELIAAAALSLDRIEFALHADDWQRSDADHAAAQILEQVGMALGSFAVREGVRDLSVDDRVLYLKIVSDLASIVNISAHPPKLFDRKERLETQVGVLRELLDDAVKFDARFAGYK
jgi:hypothetical protein